MNFNAYIKKIAARNYPYLLFIFSLFGLAYIYKYQEIVFKRPQSVHKWRQADGASLALNYYQGGMDFFKPEVHNLTSDTGKTGACYPSEVPVLYYGVACLYKIFGYHEWIFRGLNTLIFFLGLFFLFKSLLYVLKDTFWAIVLSLLFFTSPVLVYYANNYLVNASALALSLIAWYYFIRFLFEKQKKMFYIGVFFVFLAVLLKVTALFTLLAFCFIYVLEAFNLKLFNTDKKLFAPAYKFLIPMSAVFAIIFIWLRSARAYNAKHDCTYFSTNVFPIWSLDKEQIHIVLQRVRDIWFDQYFNLSVLILFAISFLYLVFSYKKANHFLYFVVIAIFFQALAYVLLQFAQFTDHDYYTIDLFILPVLILIGVFELLQRNYKKVFSSIIFKVTFFLFLCFNVYYAQSKIRDRYEGWMNDYPATKDLYTITPYLRQLGISPNDTVISIPEGSPVSLYLMNQKGWTEYIDARLHLGEPILYNSDSAGIQLSINKGAKYLIVNGIEELFKKPYLHSFATDLIGTHNRVLIFQLKNKKENFNLARRQTKARYFCDAETRSPDNESFRNANDSALLAFGKTQTDKFAHSGKYSCLLNTENPYGMTVAFPNVRYGESFVVTVWRKINTQTKSTIIAEAPDFYNNRFTVVETSKDGWEKISKEFFIDTELSGKELKIYLYNEDKVPAYFDDLEILYYESFDRRAK